MPHYIEAIAYLTACETAFQDAHPQWPDGSDVGEYLDKISELGRYKMYTLFNPAETLSNYRLLSAELTNAGVPMPT
jgi:hypothetical protein